MQGGLRALGRTEDADPACAARAQQCDRGLEGLQRDLADARRLPGAAEPADRQGGHALPGQDPAPLFLDPPAGPGEHEHPDLRATGRAVRGPGEKPLANALVRAFVRGSASSPASAFTASAFNRIEFTASAFTQIDFTRIDFTGIAEEALDDVHRTVRRP
ncbi:hypothetical protein OG298_10410 [Streptomyces sp. NBC_01005]|uniref:hypothetical protein n=1 Tax=unclassified Streptomyces TaxID=2593676 RepID=UPI00386AE05E|nr:hypothetical protein OG298_10410 [Streptomyces sp. NBC_01005]WTC94243.1 hypothetical protein OH736_10410 [Streptomyces sp. NBC_01650]